MAHAGQLPRGDLAPAHSRPGRAVPCRTDRGVAAGLYLSTSPTSGFFYVLTALHGLHLLGGIAALVYALRRVRVPAPVPPTGVLDAIGVYWHFMDALWVYLLVLLVLWF